MDRTYSLTGYSCIEQKFMEFKKLYFHSDEQGYDLHLQGIATSPNITGPYKYLGSYQPLGAPSQDFGLFLDHDGELHTNSIGRADRFP